MKKQNLPTKVCPICDRSFEWRRKWMKTWDDVKYCSKRCAGMRRVGQNLTRALAEK